VKENGFGQGENRSARKAIKRVFVKSALPVMNAKIINTEEQEQRDEGEICQRGNRNLPERRACVYVKK
jgi:hypothetical protein